MSYWAFILIGDDKTGKTSFQKHLIQFLCSVSYDRLAVNKTSSIQHHAMPRHVTTLSTMNRSYQEKLKEYGSVGGFFSSHFQEADICILSSHSHGSAITEIDEMKKELHLRAYNVAALFFSNAFGAAEQQISMLNWDERLWVNNPVTDDEKLQQSQLKLAAERFGQLLIDRAKNHWG